MVKKKKKLWGGPRKNSGRPASLPEGSVRWNVWLSQRHLSFLQIVSDQLGLGGKAPALRRILDDKLQTEE